MQRIVLDIPEKKLKFFMELLDNLGIKKIKKLNQQQVKYVDGLTQALDEVEEHLQGIKKLQNAKEFLEEL